MVDNGWNHCWNGERSLIMFSNGVHTWCLIIVGDGDEEWLNPENGWQWSAAGDHSTWCIPGTLGRSFGHWSTSPLRLSNHHSWTNRDAHHGVGIPDTDRPGYQRGLPSSQSPSKQARIRTSTQANTRLVTRGKTQEQWVLVIWWYLFPAISRLERLKPSLVLVQQR